MALDKLFLIGLIISGSIIFQSESILIVLFGSDYSAAYLTFALMLLYPIDQARGQVTGMMFLAMERTKTALLVSSFSSVIGVFFTIVLVSRVPNFGMGLGSSGVALKMLIVQFFTVNFSIYLLSRSLKFSYDYLYQFRAIAVVMFLSYIIDNFLATIWTWEGYLLVEIILNVGLTFLIITGFILFRPKWFSFEEQEISALRHYVRKFRF
ncbi:hypothetical protein [Thaumasiovibrio subtropicus]|uniref:hypothetical protein n=1 Tax=Thaumasiovibrio subtropicus TaxID=1891207 RepID=UPI001C848BCB|nr:hypothetical protein [Thaumasiovibrio subtropicus]